MAPFRPAVPSTSTASGSALAVFVGTSAGVGATANAIAMLSGGGLRLGLITAPCGTPS